MPDENPLMEMDDKALIKHIADQAEINARRILITERTAKQLIPMWHVVTPKINMIIGTPWRDDDDKGAATFYIRKLLKDDRAKAYCVTSEAWMARYGQGEIDAETEQWPKVRPIDRPNRMECVTIFACTRSEQIMRVLEMIRDRAGKLIDLKVNPLPGMEGSEEAGKLGGVMPTLFEDR